MKPKKVREERRQFAEAILGRGVLVVEGGTEASVIPAVADVSELPKSYVGLLLDIDADIVASAGASAAAGTPSDEQGAGPDPVAQ